MSISRILRSGALGAALVLGVVACSDDPTGPGVPAEGTYRASFSGDLRGNVTGDAVFGVETIEQGSVFAVLLGIDEDDMANLVILRGGTTRLEAGTHPVANTADNVPVDDDEVEIYLGIGNDTSSVIGFLEGKSGTVRVTRSTTSLVEGTFDFIVEGLIEEDGGLAEEATLHVTGGFSAEHASDPVASRLRAHAVKVRVLAR